MFDKFESFITAQATLTREELGLIRSLAVQKKVRKRQLLLQEGDVCQHKIFIAEGLLKTYTLKDDGTEHILRFSPENTWTTDAVSMESQQPSRFNIEALEDTVVLQWTKTDIQQLIAGIPSFKAYVEKLISSMLYLSYDRILMNISYTSEEKYQDFITAFPDVFRRVPLHMVASYLGVSRETLSRIRHAQLRQQR
ncbi:Crp/Fnr family transcriptional regulator [Chitinophaga rhizophila]|uniref:Crp/Fnr family transcriptional regulator n=1 Tax=Chitinophaga rhizophila TaxID=2866212 RepID=A0ABS7GJY0_9BACT|nr:Crp/Fnr family transcriptional regulator [Chitinophaga rhizophila]MBW8687495.1 Crp/Fnr family transcriptional regulator [Chitinophaga rhizophila]